MLLVRNFGHPSLFVVGRVVDGANVAVGLEEAVGALHLVPVAFLVLVLVVVGFVVMYAVLVVEMGVSLKFSPLSIRKRDRSNSYLP